MIMIHNKSVCASSIALYEQVYGAGVALVIETLWRSRDMDIPQHF